MAEARSETESHLSENEIVSGSVSSEESDELLEDLERLTSDRSDESKEEEYQLHGL